IPEIDSSATSFYFSYDDSASTAARDLTLSAIDYGTQIDPNWGRPYEYLNAEIFSHFAPVKAEPFTVSMGLYHAEVGEVPINREYSGDLYALGVNISGPTISKEERPNVVLTLLVDISGSMTSPYAAETATDIRSLMDVVKYGLAELDASLKPGDIVSIVSFETVARTVLEHWQYDATSSLYHNAVASLYAQGSTNLNAGIEEAYRVAQSSYDPEKSNRVVILTDAYANTGEVNPSIIAENTVINGLEGIHFAGVGIGQGFQDAFLHELTDIGKSVYSAVITPADARRVFTNGFMRFIDSAVNNVRFQLEYPEGFDQLQSSAEEISENEEDVRTVNFAYNSEQFFFELFSNEDGWADDDVFTLTIYFDGDEGEGKEIVREESVSVLLEKGTDEIKSAAAVTTLAQLVAGELECETVTNSGIYLQEINTDVFASYRDAISRFCERDPSL
ncbi:MAG TPA: VWA domain-containing protein, partial [Cellvibrionaceae bacterium]